MPTENGFSVDAFLDAGPVGSMASFSTDLAGTERVARGTNWAEPGYEGKIDYRIRQLSYSSLLELHSCPRKFQLYKLRTTYKADEDEKSSITFAYGHAVGAAIQDIFIGRSYEEVIWHMFVNWPCDLFANDESANKSFWSAVFSIKKFLHIYSSGVFTEYELVYYKGVPACELSFAINLPDGFRLRGFVDAVLRHRISGEVFVLECKTTKSKTVSPASYKNSAQAIGYSIGLDSLFAELSAYQVLYLVNCSVTGDWTFLPFHKNYLQRALWIRELLLDIDTIKMYEEAEVYPMRGESCHSFFRECQYFNTCTLSTEYLTKPCTPEEEDTTDYQITLTLADLLETQLEKTAPKPEKDPEDMQLE